MQNKYEEQGISVRSPLCILLEGACLSFLFGGSGVCRQVKSLTLKMTPMEDPTKISETNEDPFASDFSLHYPVIRMKCILLYMN